MPKPLKAFLLGQARALERPAPTRETFCGASRRRAARGGRGLRATGNRDAEAVSKRLGDVADEVAEGCKLGLDPEKRGAAEQAPGRGLAGCFEMARTRCPCSASSRRHRQRGAGRARAHSARARGSKLLGGRARREAPGGAPGAVPNLFQLRRRGGGGVESGSRAGKGSTQKPSEASQAHQQFQELMRELEQLSQGARRRDQLGREHAPIGGAGRTRSGAFAGGQAAGGSAAGRVRGPARHAPAKRKPSNRPRSPASMAGPWPRACRGCR